MEGNKSCLSNHQIHLLQSTIVTLILREGRLMRVDTVKLSVSSNYRFPCPCPAEWVVVLSHLLKSPTGIVEMTFPVDYRHITSNAYSVNSPMQTDL